MNTMWPVMCAYGVVENTPSETEGSGKVEGFRVLLKWEDSLNGVNLS